MLCLGAFTAFAAPEAVPQLPPELVSPLDTVQTLQGDLKVLSDGRKFAITIQAPEGGGFHRFEAELEGMRGPVLDFRAEGEIHYWRGHLVVVAPEERKALHFSMKGLVKPARMPGAPPESLPDVAELDSLLESKYELTRLDRAVAISSLSGPRAVEAGSGLRSRIAPMDLDYQDPGGGGIGSCGASCNVNCKDGSNCNVACLGSRCASCSCPASCSCS